LAKTGTKRIHPDNLKKSFSSPEKISKVEGLERTDISGSNCAENDPETTVEIFSGNSIQSDEVDLMDEARISLNGNTHFNNFEWSSLARKQDFVGARSVDGLENLKPNLVCLEQSGVIQDDAINDPRTHLVESGNWDCVKPVILEMSPEILKHSEVVCKLPDLSMLFPPVTQNQEFRQPENPRPVSSLKSDIENLPSFRATEKVVDDPKPSIGEDLTTIVSQEMSQSGTAKNIPSSLIFGPQGPEGNHLQPTMELSMDKINRVGLPQPLEQSSQTVQDRINQASNQPVTFLTPTSNVASTGLPNFPPFTTSASQTTFTAPSSATLVSAAQGTSLLTSDSCQQNPPPQVDPKPDGTAPDPRTLLATDTFQYSDNILKLFLERGCKQYPMSINMGKGKKQRSILTECQVCKLPVKTSVLLKHMESVHSVKASFVCTRCEAKFLFRHELKYHVEKVHHHYMFEFEEKYPEQSGVLNRPNLAVGQNSLQSQNQPMIQVAHDPFISQSNFNGGICTRPELYQAASKPTLKKDPVTVNSISHQLKPATYPCSFCENIFGAKQDLLRHRKVAHVPECKYCGKNMTRYSSLRRHELIHEGKAGQKYERVELSKTHNSDKFIPLQNGPTKDVPCSGIKTSLGAIKTDNQKLPNDVSTPPNVIAKFFDPKSGTHKFVIFSKNHEFGTPQSSLLNGIRTFKTAQPVQVVRKTLSNVNPKDGTKTYFVIAKNPSSLKLNTVKVLPSKPLDSKQDSSKAESDPTPKNEKMDDQNDFPRPEPDVEKTFESKEDGDVLKSDKLGHNLQTFANLKEKVSELAQTGLEQVPILKNMFSVSLR